MAAWYMVVSMHRSTTGVRPTPKATMCTNAPSAARRLQCVHSGNRLTASMDGDSPCWLPLALD